MAADQNEGLIVSLQPLGIGLTKDLAGGGEVNGVQALACFVADVLPALVEGVGLHHRPVAAPIGVVIHLFLFI